MLSAILGAIIFGLLPLYISLVINLVNEGKLFTAMAYSAGGHLVGYLIVRTIEQLTKY